MIKDALDKQILALLAANSRMPYPAIGERVGLSAPAVKRRIDRLAATGTIQAFTIAVDPAASGGGTEAFVELYCRGGTSAEQIRRLALSNPAVVAAYTVSGEADAILMVRCTDNRHLEQVIEEIRCDEAVARTTTTIVLSRLVERPV